MVEARRAKARDVAVLALLLVAAIIAVSVGRGGETRVVLDLGPNDHTYLSGFAPHYEVEDGLAVRWSTYDASIDLPLIVSGGPIVISYRFARVYAETAEVEVRLGDRTIDRFASRGGRMETRRVELAAVSETPLSLRFEIDSHERQNRGLRFDWVQLDAGERSVVSVAPRARWLPVLFAGFLFALLRFSGHSRLVAASGALAWIGLVTAGLGADPLSLLHVLRQIAAPGAVLAVGSAIVLRRYPGGRWAVVALLLGFVLRGGGLFHPEIFYPDVANARDYVETFRDTEGSLAERGVRTQELTNVGFPRNVGGKDYAFPYSPLYFLPFGALDSPGAIEDAVRLLGLAAATLATIPIFWLGLTLFGPLEGVLASFLWVVMPPVFSRLLLALHGTVVGSFLDLLVIVSIVLLLRDPNDSKRLALSYVAIQTSLLVYTSSLFSVSALVSFVCILGRSVRFKLLSVLVVAGTITVFWLYGPFVSAFFTEIIPALIASSGDAPAATAASPVGDALGRIPLFYGWVFPALALTGWLASRRRMEPEHRAVVSAWALSFVLMLGLRAFGFGVFKDLKEIVLVAPLVALLTARALGSMASRGRAGRLATIALTGWLVAFGAGRYQRYLADTPSVVRGTTAPLPEAGGTLR